ncbi:hypothetical protein PC123_g9714 [Phytophthora cactorum]|nr:hypothetical protein PC123_g9714 [Phytophthora cactorum]
MGQLALTQQGPASGEDIVRQLATSGRSLSPSPGLTRNIQVNVDPSCAEVNSHPLQVLRSTAKRSMTVPSRPRGR